MPPESVRAVFFDLGDTLVTKPRQWIPGAQGALSSLRFKKLRLGVISNTGESSRDALLGELPVDFSFVLFDPKLILLSSEVGIKKPNVKIFELAVERSELPSSQCLFCTENLLDSLVAQRAGMRVARVQKPPQSDMEKLIDTLALSGLVV